MSLAELKDRQATLATKMLKVPVNESASGDKIIWAIQPGKLFYVYGIWLRAEGAVAITWKSGSTAITGAITLANAEVKSVFQEIPILKGRAKGDDLVLSLSLSVGVRGWVTLTEV